MIPNILQDKVFASLQISKDIFLGEIAMLLVKQQISEYSMEIDFFEKKYGKSFLEFDREFQTQSASYHLENDWMDWKFALDSRDYWQHILK